MKRIYCFFMFIIFVAFSQNTMGQRTMENLGRGLVAVKNSGNNGVYINWRITGQEWYDVSYNLYRDGIKINNTPITGASNYTDKNGTLASKYQVTAIVKGIEQEKCDKVGVLPNPYMEFELASIDKIPGVPEKHYKAYSINDITTADLDGDGEYELIIKRVNGSLNLNDHFENKYYTLFDAYKIYRNDAGLPEWKLMWRINVGPNLFDGPEINCMVFDFDGDGKAEVVMRTSEGTIDGKGKIFGPSPVTTSVHTSVDKVRNYRDHLVTPGQNQWYISAGPEYLSLFDGITGEELDRTTYIDRDPITQWGRDRMSRGQLAHRANKFFIGAPYLDGKTPSLFISRGIYHRIKMRAYDIIDKKFRVKWFWDSERQSGPYAGQGNHNFVIADVDGDGCDEIVFGQMTINNDGSSLYTTGLGHGDAMHVGNFDPYRKGLEVFGCLESPGGSSLRKAENGENIQFYNRGRDLGRCMAANFSNLYKGTECWLAPGVYSASERKETSLPGGSQNFRIYWTGDLLEELVDHHWNKETGKGKGRIQKFNDTTKTWSDIFVSDYYSINHTKANPNLQADLFGDWREELIWRNDDDTKIRIHFTTYPTEHRIYTLMHDMQYRQAIGWQMCAYNQPPHPSFFLGERENILVPPPPVMDNQFLVFQPTSGIWNTASGNWKKDGRNAVFANGENVLFDVSGHIRSAIKLEGTVSPTLMKVNSPEDYEFDMSGGKLSGTMRLIKQGAGKMTFNGKHDFTGDFDIWDGSVAFNGTLKSNVWTGFFVELEAEGSIERNLTMRYAASLYPGTKDKIGILSVGGDLSFEENNVIVFNVDGSSKNNDKITVGRKLTLGKNLSVEINSVNKLTAGDYVLFEYKGKIEGNISDINLKVNDKVNYKLVNEGRKIMLRIKN